MKTRTFLRLAAGAAVALCSLALPAMADTLEDIKKLPPVPKVEKKPEAAPKSKGDDDRKDD